MVNICLSGGAKGADITFGECAKQAGHNVIHFAFGGMRCTWPNKDEICNLSELSLLMADHPLLVANTYLRRSYPTKSLYVNNLLRRNYWQIKTTKTIYAISYIVERGMVGGGTGWAVTMGILNDVAEVYVFDQNENQWWRFDENDGERFWWKGVNSPPKPHGLYTGIGSVDITPSGVQAIKDLYVE